MKKIDLEKYIVLSVENKKIQIVYNAENTDLYLWKYGSFYVTRDCSRIIPNCPDENILFLKKGEKNIICNNDFFDKDYPYMVFRQKYPDIYIISKDKSEINMIRMLLSIFKEEK